MFTEQASLTMILIAVVILRFLNKIAKKVNKCWGRVVLCIAVSFLVIGSALFVRPHIIPFGTAEEAYKSVYGGKAEVVVEGNNSGYIIGDKGKKYFKKSEKGWVVPIFNITVMTAEKTIGSTTIRLYRYNFSEEYYVTVMDSDNASLVMSDNRDSTFYQIDRNGTSGVWYCTYVHQINDEYIMTINGVEVKLFE